LIYGPTEVQKAPRDPAAYRVQAMARDVIALGEHLGLAEYALCAYGVGSELTSRVVNLGAPVTRAVMCGWGGPPSDLLDQYASEEWARQAERLAEGFEADEPDALSRVASAGGSTRCCSPCS